MEGGSHLPPLHLVLLRLAPAHGQRSLLLVRILRLVRHDGRGRYAQPQATPKSSLGAGPAEDDATQWSAREFCGSLSSAWRGKMGMHLWQVVGRHVPTDRNPKPKIFRMKVFAEDEVRAPFSGHTFFSGAGKLAALAGGAPAGAGVHGDAGLTEGQCRCLARRAGG